MQLPVFRSVNPFVLKPKHWWDYINPFFWRRKRIVEAILKYEWEKANPAVYKAVKDALLYGEGSFHYDGERLW